MSDYASLPLAAAFVALVLTPLITLEIVEQLQRRRAIRIANAIYLTLAPDQSRSHPFVATEQFWAGIRAARCSGSVHEATNHTIMMLWFCYAGDLALPAGRAFALGYMSVLRPRYEAIVAEESRRIQPTVRAS